MPAAPTAVYHRTVQDARRIGESFRASTKGIDAKRLREKLAELAAAEIPEATTGKHTTGYIGAIMEVAADVTSEKDRLDARKFATAFVHKDAGYSRTKAGLAAVQLEAWIIENGGTLYGQFVETVLDSGDSKFLAIFQGKIADLDMERLRTGTASFVKMEAIAEAGAVNYDSAELLEFSMFDCTAVGKQPKDIQPKDATQTDQMGTVGAPQFAHETILPTTREEYDRVYESGGVTKTAAVYLFGRECVSTAKVEDGQLAFHDKNDVRWISEDGETWMPDVDSIVERKPAEDAEEEDDEPDEEETCEAAIYEVNPRTNALRSLFHTWAAFTSDVLAEGEETRGTIVVVGRKAYNVTHATLEEVTRIVQEASNDCVERQDLVGGDALIESALLSLVLRGTLCENSTEVVQTVLPEADDEKKPTEKKPPGDKPANPS